MTLIGGERLGQKQQNEVYVGDRGEKLTTVKVNNPCKEFLF